MTTEHGSIGEDEPVFVIRAQDKLAVHVIGAYRQMCKDAGSPQHHLDGIDETMRTVFEWQENNFTKIPESA